MVRRPLLPRPRPEARAAAAPGGPAGADGPEVDWERLISAVIRDPERLSLLFQPIVSITEGTIAGYETLSRFARPDRVSAEVARELTPDRWFLAADELGAGAELEGLVVARSLDLRTSLPPDTFLTFNVSPHLVTEPAIRDLLLRAGTLSRIVVEFTEHRDVPDLAPLVLLRDQVAELGGLLALDDAGSGYSGLQQMTRLRPHLIKLDRALVESADRDEVKLALAELLGEFAGRIDAWLLAEGVETWGELEAFARIGVPLGQGYLLGRPAAPWSELDPRIAERLRRNASRAHLREHAVALMEPFWVPGVRGAAARVAEATPGAVGLRLDRRERPQAVFVPGVSTGPEGAEWLADGHRESPVSLRVSPADDVADVARRVVTRPAEHRFDPVVCIDERGRAIGVIRVERLLTRLAELKSAA